MRRVIGPDSREKNIAPLLRRRGRVVLFFLEPKGYGSAGGWPAGRRRRALLELEGSDGDGFDGSAIHDCVIANGID